MTLEQANDRRNAMHAGYAATLAGQVADLLREREQLRAEMTIGSNPDPQWWRDRIDSLAYCNRRLVALCAIPSDVAIG